MSADLSQFVKYNVARKDWPRCLTCDMPVEMFYADILVKDGTVLLVSICHGETEVLEVRPEVWDWTIPEFVIFGSVFGPIGEEPEWAKQFD